MFGTSPFSSAPFADEGPKIYDLTASATSTGTPVLNSVSMSEEETLSTSGELRTDNPLVDMPAFNQGQTLASEELATNSPTVSETTLQEDETFSADNITLGVVSLDTLDIIVDHILSTSTDLESGSVEVSVATFNQDQVLETSVLSTGSADVTNTTMQEEETLYATLIETLSPSVGVAGFIENSVLSADNINTGSTIVNSTTMVEDETFTTPDMSTGSVSLATTSINQDQTFEFPDLDTGPSIVSDIAMSEEETLTAREPVINDPETPSVDFNQGQTLESVTLVISDVYFSPTMIKEDEKLYTDELSTGSVSLLVGVLRQEHLLGEAANINTGIRQIDAGFFTQNHSLDNDELLSNSHILDLVEIEADHKFSPPNVDLVGHNVEEAYFNPAFAREVNADNKIIGNRAVFKGGNNTKFGRTAGNRVKVG